jgi:hypothetical protein
MFQNDFLPQLTANSLPLHMQWFMQDGVTLHTSDFVLGLYTVSGCHVTSNCCPDWHNCGKILATCHPWPESLWLFWGWEGCFLKGVFAQKPANELQMRGMLAELCRGIEEDSDAMLLQTCRQPQDVDWLVYGFRASQPWCTYASPQEVTTLGTYWYNKNLYICWAMYMKFVVDRQPLHFV